MEMRFKMFGYLTEICFNGLKIFYPQKNKYRDFPTICAIVLTLEWPVFHVPVPWIHIY